MPLTPKGQSILRDMYESYGHSERGKKKAKSVFYAMKNMGKLKGVD